MGKSDNVKDLILLSGFSINDNNRGSAALGYGAIAFLRAKNLVESGDHYCTLKRMGIRFWYWNLRKGNNYQITVNGKPENIKIIRCFSFEYQLYIRYGLILKFTCFAKLLYQLKLVAATNGGDGLTDIYGHDVFMNRFVESKLAVKSKTPLIILPQTIGPFINDRLKKIAVYYLQYATYVFVRDNKFERELKNMGIDYGLERDLSYYMSPEPLGIEVKENAIGINVSGLTYYNSYKTLAGHFESYPKLIMEIISFFHNKGLPIYLIPHSYNYRRFERNNDDLEACRDLYRQISDKDNIYIIDMDLTAPQVKYVISKMSFFIGSRMHANFAAMFSNIPVFGLAYSYKFEGAFVANGLPASQTYMINDLPENNIKNLIALVGDFYLKSLSHEKA